MPSFLPVAALKQTTSCVKLNLVLAGFRTKVRGTPHNTGDGLKMAFEMGACRYGKYDGCHATPMDLHMKDYGNLDIPPKTEKELS